MKTRSFQIHDFMCLWIGFHQTKLYYSISILYTNTLYIIGKEYNTFKKLETWGISWVYSTPCIETVKCDGGGGEESQARRQVWIDNEIRGGGGEALFVNNALPLLSIMIVQSKRGAAPGQSHVCVCVCVCGGGGWGKGWATLSRTGSQVKKLPFWL